MRNPDSEKSSTWTSLLTPNAVDDIPVVLKGILFIHGDTDLRDKIFALLVTHLRYQAD